ncbi:MAG: M48 family metallopeptidase [Sphingomonas sp.]
MEPQIQVVRHARARRAKLCVDPVTGAVRLTLPKRAAIGPSLRWASEQRDWVTAQRSRLPAPRPFAPGAVLPFGDTELIVRWAQAWPRRVERSGSDLRCGGPIEGVSGRITAWLQRQALAVLTVDTGFFAARAGVLVERVGVGDPRGRWGSCSASGAIRYSWRLILVPEAVRRATVAHEVAHRVHMNHGPAFHALVAELLGEDPAPARAWLRANGAALHWFGRSS